MTTPYSLPQKDKEEKLLAGLQKLTSFHEEKCPPYKKLLEIFWPEKTEAKSLMEIPYLPVNLFKTQELKSIPAEEVFKILRSSGTTSSHPSKIFLSKEAAARQTHALAEIITSYIGPERLPLLILDHPEVIRDLAHYSARGAALVGMLTFGRDIIYAFDSEMNLKVSEISEWVEKHKQEPILLFGLTSIVYEGLLETNSLKLSLPNATLIHSGGWKKLSDKAISNELFKKKLKDTLGIKRCFNFYGMVEQIGSVFMECEEGYFHAPAFSDVIIRDPKTWEEAKTNETGVVEVLSLLPDSYPGHALLTEDLGVIAGIDDCPCQRKGKRFLIKGRVPQAEIRGCSDTYSFGATK